VPGGQALAGRLPVLGRPAAAPQVQLHPGPDEAEAGGRLPALGGEVGDGVDRLQAVPERAGQRGVHRRIMVGTGRASTAGQRAGSPMAATTSASAATVWPLTNASTYG